MPENNCTCEGLGDLKDRVDKLEERVDNQRDNAQALEISLVAIQRDLEYIKEKITQTSKLGSGIIDKIIGAVIVALISYIAVKVGLA